MIKLSISGIVKKIEGVVVTIETDGELNQVRFYSAQDLKKIAVEQKIRFYAEIDENLDIYGYFSKSVRKFVAQFESVSGVGRRGAMAIYNTLTEQGMSMNDICYEISARNVMMLSKIPGLNIKCAQRIIDSLQSTIMSFHDNGADGQKTLLNEAKEMLLSLGFCNQISIMR